MTKSAYRWSALLMSCAFALLLASPVQAQNVSLAAVDQHVTVSDGVANATFRIKLTNNEESAITNVFVVFSDDTTDSLGDVAAGGSVTSEPETKLIELKNNSASIPVPVTLKFSMNGEPVEVKLGITLGVTHE